MKPGPPDDDAALVRQLREQLILAQVRIMELEDERDEITSRRSEIDSLLQDAQRLADRKMEALTHLEQVHADLEKQCAHLRHMQHVTNEALNQTRAQLRETDGRRADAEQQHRLARQEIAALQAEVAGLHDQVSRLGDRIAALDTEVGAVTATAAARLARLSELDAEIRAMKASRSWRWTRFIRSLERFAARRRRHL